jgi:hypothetical protein
MGLRLHLGIWIIRNINANHLHSIEVVFSIDFAFV